MKKSDLETIKKSLLERQEQILKNINDSSNSISELQNTRGSDELDQASINTDSNLEYSISFKQRTELANIQRALAKIQNGTYGICEMCEEEISPARLKANPSARLCITCKEISERKFK
ncbi:MAG: RNA polymerase-binding protein DksA [Campylobacter sp.]|nr:RNA polymerase-binding protein DksA [Campylobacter sp.]